MKRLREILGEDMASLEADLNNYMKKPKPAPTNAFAGWPASIADTANKVNIRREAPVTKIEPKQPVDTTGANSPFADKTITSYDKNKFTVSPDKPMVPAIKSDAVSKALGAKGYNAQGQKVTAIPSDTGVERNSVPVGSLPKQEPAKVPIPQARPKDLNTGGDHTISKGDTLWDIAKAKGTTVDNLMKLNPGLKAKSLQIGAKIKLR